MTDKEKINERIDYFCDCLKELYLEIDYLKSLIISLQKSDKKLKNILEGKKND